jgi:hypothetical protein
MMSPTTTEKIMTSKRLDPIEFEQPILKDRLDDIRLAYKHIKIFNKFANKACLPMFEFLFDDNATYMFQEIFIGRCDRDPIKFFNSLDTTNKDVLMVNLFGQHKNGRAVPFDENPMFMFG